MKKTIWGIIVGLFVAPCFGAIGGGIGGQFIQLQDKLQSGATFYVSSGTVSNLHTSTITFSDGTSLTTANSTVSATSNLAVNVNGVQISSPTKALSFDSNFTGTQSPTGTSNISLSPGTTLYIHNSDTLQSGTTFYVSSGTVSGQLSSIRNNLQTILLPSTTENFQLVNVSSYQVFMVFKSSNTKWWQLGTDVTNLGGTDFDLYNTTTGIKDISVSTADVMTLGANVILSPLTASQPVKTNASKQLTSGLIDVTSDIMGIVPDGNLPTNLVHINNQETISGSKVFSASQTFTGNVVVNSTFSLPGSTIVISGTTYYWQAGSGGSGKFLQNNNGVITSTVAGSIINTLAFTTGTSSGFTVPTSTNPSAVVLDSTTFKTTLTGGNTVFVTLNQSSVTLSGSLVAGTNITITPNSNGTTTLSSNASGAAALAVTTGTISGFSVPTSTPTNAIVFDSTTFRDTLTGSATSFIRMNQSSVTLSGVLVAGTNIALTPSNGSTTISAVSFALPLPPGSTTYIQNTETLQSGSTFYVSSGTVSGQFKVITSSGGSVYFDGNSYTPDTLTVNPVMKIRNGAPSSHNYVETEYDALNASGNYVANGYQVISPNYFLWYGSNPLVTNGFGMYMGAANPEFFIGNTGLWSDGSYNLLVKNSGGTLQDVTSNGIFSATGTVTNLTASTMTASIINASSETVDGQLNFKDPNSSSFIKRYVPTGPGVGPIDLVFPYVNVAGSNGGYYKIIVSSDGSVNETSGASLNQTEFSMQPPFGSGLSKTIGQFNIYLETYTMMTAGGDNSNQEVDYGADLRVTSSGKTHRLALQSPSLHYQYFKSSDSISADNTWVIPPADGTNGQSMQTNGSGNLFFAAVSSISQNGNYVFGSTVTFNAGSTVAVQGVMLDGSGSAGTTNYVWTSQGAGLNPRWKAQMGTGGGGAGSSNIINVTTGTSSGYTVPTSTNPSAIVLDSTTFKATLTGGNTVFFTMNSSSVTLQGPVVSSVSVNSIGQAQLSFTVPSLSSTQTWTAGQTFSSSITLNGTNLIAGTTTNDNARQGDIGQTASTATTVGIAFAGSNTWGDAVSTTVAAGDYLFNALGVFQKNSATMTGIDFELGISTVSGNSSSTLVQGDNYCLEDGLSTTNTNLAQCSIPGYHISFGSPTTVYLKYYVNAISSGTPKFMGRLSLVRIR